MKSVYLSIIILLMFGCHSSPLGSRDAEIRRLQELAVRLIDEDFTSAKVQDGHIMLSTSKVIDFEGLEGESVNGQTVYMIRKHGRSVYFTLDGAVDDEVGLVYSPENTISVDGIMKLERVGGSWFSFSTR